MSAETPAARAGRAQAFDKGAEIARALRQRRGRGERGGAAQEFTTVHCWRLLCRLADSGQSDAGQAQRHGAGMIEMKRLAEQNNREKGAEQRRRDW